VGAWKEIKGGGIVLREEAIRKRKIKKKKRR